ncbi:MAG: hypothetical protein HYZ38_04945 [Mycobacterium sp.]|nr:hypothetical protein [Mycobacterium sp.]
MIGVKITPDELDDALLAALRGAPGQVMPWAELRDLPPASAYWQRVESLTRLEVSGAVHVTKVDGLNYCALGYSTPPPRRRPASTVACPTMQS